MNNTQKEFIDMIGNAAREFYKVYNILPSLVVAMACKESGFNNSQLSRVHHNYFGMKWNTKCGCKWVEYNTKEWDKTAQKYVTVKAKFRSYDSVEDGIKGFYEFLQYKRYANLKGEKDPAQACIKIQSDGWATSPTYATSLYNDYILKYNLVSFDKDDAATPVLKPTYIRGQIYKTDVNLYIRETPGGKKRKMYEVTANARVNSYVDTHGDVILKAGTRVTCLDVVQEGYNTWLLIPSGYICAKYQDKIYVGGV